MQSDRLRWPPAPLLRRGRRGSDRSCAVEQDEMAAPLQDERGSPFDRHFPFAGPQATILSERPARFNSERPPSPRIAPIFPLQHAHPALDAAGTPIPARFRVASTSPPTRTNAVSVGRWRQPLCTSGGSAPNRRIRSKIATNKFRVTATSASWNVTYLVFVLAAGTGTRLRSRHGPQDIAGTHLAPRRSLAISELIRAQNYTNRRISAQNRLRFALRISSTKKWKSPSHPCPQGPPAPRLASKSTNEMRLAAQGQKAANLYNSCRYSHSLHKSLLDCNAQCHRQL